MIHSARSRHAGLGAIYAFYKDSRGEEDTADNFSGQMGRLRSVPKSRHRCEGFRQVGSKSDVSQPRYPRMWLGRLSLPI